MLNRHAFGESWLAFNMFISEIPQDGSPDSRSVIGN